MAQERSITPEKQLLRLIEDSKPAGAVLQARVIKRHGLSLFSPAAWRGRFSFSKESTRKWVKEITPSLLDLKKINSVLIFFIIAAAVYFIGSIPSSVIKLRKISLSNFRIQANAEKPAPVRESQSVKKAASYYAEVIRQKDIFKMGAKPAPAGTEAVIQAPSSRIIEATQDLRLVGISWSRDPDAMIEDTKATRTYFVKKGQMIGEVKVQAIFKDKVILSFGGEEIEIR